MADLRFPIGTFTFRDDLTSADREELTGQIEHTPKQVRDAVAGLTEEQLDTPYRDGGWTVRQVVHHLVESHVNAYVRFRLGLTEDNPTIKPYDQATWAELEDAKNAPVEPSLSVLDGLHARWVMLLRSLREDAFARKLIHPEEEAPISIDWLLQMYAWHGRHHTAHITALRQRNGW